MLLRDTWNHAAGIQTLGLIVNPCCESPGSQFGAIKQDLSACAGMMLQALRRQTTVHSILEMQTLIKSKISKIKSKGMGV